MDALSLGRRMNSKAVGYVAVAALVVGLLAGCDTSALLLSGRVTGTSTGVGISGTMVSVYADDAPTLLAQVPTSPAGSYELRLSSLDEGTYRVRVGNRWWPDASSWAEAGGLGLSTESPVTFDVLFDEVASVAGIVVDDERAPLQSVSVALVDAEDHTTKAVAATESNGGFRLPVLEPGAYSILLVGPGGVASFVGGATAEVLDIESGKAFVGQIDLATGLPPLGSVSLASVSSSGVPADAPASRPSLSADGRFVAFNSRAENLVAYDTNGDSDVFVHDRATGSTTRVSVASSGAEADGDSQAPVISGDGRFVAFGSEASNLVDSLRGGYDYYVHDRQTGATALVGPGNDDAPYEDREAPRLSISHDGRYVAFGSDQPDVVVGDANGESDVFVRDMQTGITEAVSVTSGGLLGDGWSGRPSISGDGRFVAFESGAPNLADGEVGEFGDVFVHDRLTGETSRIATDANGFSDGPAISADGQVVALLRFDLGSAVNRQVFVHDRATGNTSVIGATTDGKVPDGVNGFLSISSDGRYVAYYSQATNLAVGSGAGGAVYVTDRSTGVTTRVSMGLDGSWVHADSIAPSISADGRVVAFAAGDGSIIVNER